MLLVIAVAGVWLARQPRGGDEREPRVSPSSPATPPLSAARIRAEGHLAPRPGALVTVSSEMNVLIVGVLLVLFVVLAPDGIVGLVKKWLRRSSG